MPTPEPESESAPQPQFPPATQGEPPVPQRPARMTEVVGAVFWSFFGVRKGRAMRKDAVTVRPHQVVLVGVAMGLGLVLTLLLVVRLIIRAAGA